MKRRIIPIERVVGFYALYNAWIKISRGDGKDKREDVILPSDAADVVVEVIPALNNMAARVVTIHAVAPTPILDLAGEEITDEKGEAITA